MAVVSTDDLRRYLQDMESTNLSLGVQYLTPEDLTYCLNLAVDDYNETPPMFFFTFTLADFPYRKLLLLGAAVEAMHLTAAKELRGEMSYNDGGIASMVYHKAPQFNQLKQELQQEYKELKMRIKRQVNLHSGFGGME